MVSEGKSSDRFSAAGIAGTYFCGFLWLNIVSALMALVFSPPCSGLAIKELCLVVCRTDGEQRMLRSRRSVLSSGSNERLTAHGLSLHFARTDARASWELAQVALLDKK